MKDTCRTAENARHKRTGEKQTNNQTNKYARKASHSNDSVPF